MGYKAIKYSKRKNVISPTANRIKLSNQIILYNIFKHISILKTFSYDLFGIEGDKIVEHWDVIHEVPEKMANDSGMF